MAPSEQTIEKLFELVIGLEYKTADIYRRLARMCSSLPELAAYWQDLVEDEMGHATTLEKAKKSLTPEQLRLPADQKLFRTVTTTLLMLGENPVEALETLDDAYELAHQLEFSEFNGLFEFLTTEFFPSAEQKRLITTEIVHHQMKLTEFRGLFGDKTWRKSLKLQPE